MAQPLDGQAQFKPELRQVVAADVPQLDVLEIVPDAFIGIEFRGVAGELLQLQPSRGAPSQEVFDDLRPMDRRAIPDDKQRAREVAEQVLEKADHIRAAKWALLDREQQPPVLGQPADGGEMIVGQRRVQQRALTAGRVRADQPR